MMTIVRAWSEVESVGVIEKKGLFIGIRSDRIMGYTGNVYTRTLESGFGPEFAIGQPGWLLG